jgi:hypothetical protein
MTRSSTQTTEDVSLGKGHSEKDKISNFWLYPQEHE